MRPRSGAHVQPPKPGAGIHVPGLLHPAAAGPSESPAPPRPRSRAVAPGARLALLVPALLLGAATAHGAPPGGGLTASTEHSTDGVFQLSWDAAGPVVVEESATPDFEEVRVVYDGRDQATSLTGRRDGTYYYRLRTDASAGTEPLVVVVEHHSLARALGFFGVGLAVFLATVALVVRGASAETSAGATGGTHA